MTGLHGANRLASKLSLARSGCEGGVADALFRARTGRARTGAPPEISGMGPRRAIRSEERVMITQSWTRFGA